jgi:uncharacterized membrane-anchored protein YjiN (DUF445 family)
MKDIVEQFNMKPLTIQCSFSVSKEVLQFAESEVNAMREIRDGIVKCIQNPKGAGRKNKYKEKTTTIAFRCPESKKEEVTNMIKDKLKEWEV